MGEIINFAYQGRRDVNVYFYVELGLCIYRQTRRFFFCFTSSCFLYTFLILSSHMEFIQSVVLPVLPFVQIILSILLVAAILLQQRGSSLGGAFGGDNFSATFHKRRGGELFLFRFSVVIAILFVLSALITVIF